MTKTQGNEILLVLWFIATMFSGSVSGFSPLTAFCGIMVIVQFFRAVLSK